MDINLDTHRSKFLFNHMFAKMDGLNFHPNELNDICRYFWACVWTYIAVTTLYILIITTAVMFIPVGMQVVHKLFGWFSPVISDVLNDLISYHVDLAVLAFIGIVGSTVIYFVTFLLGGLWVIVSAAEKVGDYRRRKIDEGYVPQPSVITTYYRALKEKTCITINYKNG